MKINLLKFLYILGCFSAAGILLIGLIGTVINGGGFSLFLLRVGFYASLIFTFITLMLKHNDIL